MQNLRRFHVVERDVLSKEHFVRTVAAGEGKLPLAVLTDVDKCQRGEILGRQQQPRHIHTMLRQRIPQEAAVHIIARLADEGAFRAQLAHGRGDVGHRAARILREQAHPQRIFPRKREVDENFPHDAYVKLFHNASLLSCCTSLSL